MKKFSLLVIAVLITLIMPQRSIAQSKIFKDAAKIDNVTSVYISPTLLKFGARQLRQLGHGIDEAIQQISEFEVITCDEDVAKIPEVKRICRPIIKSMKCEVLLDVNDEGDKTTIYAKIIPNSDIAELIFVEVDEPDEYTVIYIKGKINITKLAAGYSY